MLAAHTLMGISIQNTLFSNDRFCMTDVTDVCVYLQVQPKPAQCPYAMEHVLCRPLLALLFWCPVVWVGPLLYILCSGTCRFPSQVSDLWAVGICLLSRDAREVTLTYPIAICNQCHFP